VNKLTGHGYEWIETTTPNELGAGIRQFARGRKLGPDLEPWTLEVQGGPIAGWVDQFNQIRWLSPDNEPSDPGWRRLYVERRSA
jgi:hypothetical protein